MHLCDHARAYIHERYRRPLRERMIRALLAWVLPHPRRFRAALSLARLARPGAPLLWRIKALRPFAALDRKSVVEGKRVSVRVVLGGRRIFKKKKHNINSHLNRP